MSHRASASVTLDVVPPVEMTDRHAHSWTTPPIVVDQVTWEHTYNAETGAEALSVRASNSVTFRGNSWHVIAGAPGLLREVPAWIPAPPEGWDAFIVALKREHEPAATKE